MGFRVQGSGVRQRRIGFQPVPSVSAPPSTHSVRFSLLGTYNRQNKSAYTRQTTSPSLVGSMSNLAMGVACRVSVSVGELTILQRDANLGSPGNQGTMCSAQGSMNPSRASSVECCASRLNPTQKSSTLKNISQIFLSLSSPNHFHHTQAPAPLPKRRGFPTLHLSPSSLTLYPALHLSPSSPRLPDINPIKSEMKSAMKSTATQFPRARRASASAAPEAPRLTTQS
jgi:hypothetical protein